MMNFCAPLLKCVETLTTLCKTATLANAVPSMMISLWKKRKDLGNILEVV